MSSKIVINNASGEITIDGSPIGGGAAELPAATEEGQLIISNSSNQWVAQTVRPTFKNRVINGGMTINQRAAASVSTDASYVVDRWRPRVSGIASTWSLAQSALVPTGFSNSLGFSVTSGAGAVSAGTFSTFLYLFEGTSISDFAWGSAAAKTITISFWARSSIAGTYCVSVRNASATRSYVAEYSIISSNTWQKVSATISGDTSGTWATGTGTGLILEFNLGTGSNLQGAAGAWLSGNFIASANQTNLIGVTGATFYLTGVQLEVGSFATDFELRPRQMELALCQRYYSRMNGGTGYAPMGAGNCYLRDGGIGNDKVHIYVKYPIAMRSSPTISISSGFSIFDGSTHVTGWSLQGYYSGNESANLLIDAGNTALVAGRPYILLANNSPTAFIAFSSEL